MTGSTLVGQGARLAALYVAAFAVLGVSLPFLPVWLGAQGVPSDAIGVVLAIPIVVRIVFSAPLLSLVDRGLAPRRLLVGAYALAAAAYLVLPSAAAAGVPLLALAVALAALAQAPVIPASDLLTLAAARADARLAYGRIRLWGSVAFLAANVGMGYLVAAAGAGSVAWALVGLAAAGAVVAAFAVPPLDLAAARDEQARFGTGPAALPPVLKRAIAAAALTQASHAAVYAYGSLLWQANGFTGGAIGWLWAIGVAAEIAVFALLGRWVGRDRGARTLLLAGSAAAIVRAAGLAAEPGLLATALLQALHGLTFGATHLGAMAALASLAPEGARARAQGVLATAMALATAAATVLGGFAYGSAGPLAFLAMIPLAGAGLLLAATLPRAPRPSP